MKEKVNIDKEPKEKEQLRKKEHTPFMQVNKHSDPISNFISNFKSQFKKAKGLGFGKLFRGKGAEPEKPTAEFASIIGATKTVMRVNYQNAKENQAAQTNTKASLRKDNSIKMEQPKSKKHKLGL